MKITAFWDKVLCSLLEVDRRFGAAYCLQHQGETTRHYIPQGYHLYKRCRKNLKWHLSNMTKLLLLLREGTE
jgi:hypothetical protein